MIFCRLAYAACARGAVKLRHASTSVSRLRAVGIQHRANPGGQVPLPVFRSTFLVTTALDGVHRHGKSLAFQRWMDRWASRSLRQLFAHGSILPRALLSFNEDLDGTDFDGQSILIEILRGRDATAMQAITRRTSRFSWQPPVLLQFRAIRRLVVLSQERRNRAPPNLLRAEHSPPRGQSAVTKFAARHGPP